MEKEKYASCSSTSLPRGSHLPYPWPEYIRHESPDLHTTLALGSPTPSDPRGPRDMWAQNRFLFLSRIYPFLVSQRRGEKSRALLPTWRRLRTGRFIRRSRVILGRGGEIPFFYYPVELSEERKRRRGVFPASACFYPWASLLKGTILSFAASPTFFDSLLFSSFVLPSLPPLRLALWSRELSLLSSSAVWTWRRRMRSRRAALCRRAAAGPHRESWAGGGAPWRRGWRRRRCGLGDPGRRPRSSAGGWRSGPGDPGPRPGPSSRRRCRWI